MRKRDWEPTSRSGNPASPGARRGRGRGAAALALALALPHGAPAGWTRAAEAAPSLLIPAGSDSAFRDPGPESPPAPLLVPGRPGTPAPTRAERAREQFDRGLALERENLPAAAIIAYDNALQLDPALPEANFRIGLLYLSRDQVAPAVRRFAAEVRRDSGHVAAARELGVGLARLGDTTLAIAQLERLTRLRPQDDESWRALGFAYSAAGRVADAEAALRRAGALHPERPSERRDLAALLATVGREAEAREHYRRALELDPNDAATWYNLANLDRRDGRLEEALASYRRASAADPGLTLALEGEILVLGRLGREAESAAATRKLVAARPDDHDLRLEAVRLLAGLGRGEEALELARDGVARHRRSAAAHAVLAAALEATGDLRAAREELRRAERLGRSAEERDRIRRMAAGWRAASDPGERAPAADSTTREDP